MFLDGMIVTSPPRDRVSPGPLTVRHYEPSRCWNGYTLFSPAFGDTEYLIDMNGMVVHTWPVTHSQYAELRADGRLMADNVGDGIEELAPDGRRLWHWEGYYHHDFHIVEEDLIALLVRSDGETSVEGFYSEGFDPGEMHSDVLRAINRRGETVWEFRLRDHIESMFDKAGLPLPVRYGQFDEQGRPVERTGPADWAHTNTLEVLPDTPAGRKDPRFRAGNLLISMRALDTIAVIDLERNDVVWAWGPGVLDGQHQPIMTDAGTILIYDNGTARGWSAAVEVDPTADEVVWRYEDRAGFFSAYRSGVQRLPNGNTLIAESDAGRLFEVTPGGEVVWDYYMPFMALCARGQGRHVYRATRYAYDDPGVSAVLEAIGDERVGGVGDATLRPIATYREAVAFYRCGLRG